MEWSKTDQSKARSSKDGTPLNNSDHPWINPWGKALVLRERLVVQTVSEFLDGFLKPKRKKRDQGKKMIRMALTRLMNWRTVDQGCEGR